MFCTLPKLKFLSHMNFSVCIFYLNGSEFLLFGKELTNNLVSFSKVVIYSVKKTKVHLPNLQILSADAFNFEGSKIVIRKRVNSLQNRYVLDRSKLKEFADNKESVTKLLPCCLLWDKKIFLLFRQC